jgi:small subunit ribosomal protein S17
MPKRILQGTVVGKSGKKTVKVKVTRRVEHPTYKKIITLSKNYLAHDEGDHAVVGQNIRIQECRPLSKLKRWEVIGAASAK